MEIPTGGGGGSQKPKFLKESTVEALIRDHLGNSEKLSQLELRSLTKIGSPK